MKWYSVANAYNSATEKVSEGLAHLALDGKYQTMKAGVSVMDSVRMGSLEHNVGNATAAANNTVLGLDGDQALLVVIGGLLATFAGLMMWANYFAPQDGEEATTENEEDWEVEPRTEDEKPWM